MARSARPTIADVAQLAGVSRGAVSQVFNGRGNISEATQTRIREAAAKLHWTPSPTAVALRRSRSRTIGLVLHSLGATPDLGGSSANLIAGIEAVLSPRNYGLLLHVFGGDPGEEAAAYRELTDARRVDGVILTDSRVGDERFALLRELGLPAVLVGAPWSDDPVPHLDTDPVDAGLSDAVAHLVDLGHRSIAYIGGPLDRVQPLRRREAFEASLRERGITPRAVIATDYSAAAAIVNTRALLTDEDPPTAIAYGTDLMAIAGMKEAKKVGLAIPDDVSVLGYDGLALGELVEPELTTVRRDTVARGRVAAMRILGLLGEEIDEQPPPIATELVVRASTGPAAN